MSYPVTFEKTYFGPQCHSSIPIPGCDRWELRVSTSKHPSGGIWSHAQAVLIGKDGLGFSFSMMQDYSRTLGRWQDVRATERATRNHHAEALAVIDSQFILPQAAAHQQALEVQREAQYAREARERAEREMANRAGCLPAATADAEAMLNDFNWVGSRHHY
jgi:hypothetical protein